jgi:hypothetical protein
MPVVLPDQHMAVAWHHTGGNVTGEMVNTCAFDINASTESDPQATLDALSSLWGAGPQASHVNAIMYTKATAMFHASSGDMIAYESTAGAIGGSAGADMMPLNVSVIVNKRTGIAGRKYRGRFLFGGFPLTWAVGANPNELDTTVLTGQQAVWDAFYAACIAVGCVPVLLHQAPATTSTQITDFIVRALVGNVKKRIR